MGPCPRPSTTTPSFVAVTSGQQRFRRASATDRHLLAHPCPPFVHQGQVRVLAMGPLGPGRLPRGELPLIALRAAQLATQQAILGPQLAAIDFVRLRRSYYFLNR